MQHPAPVAAVLAAALLLAGCATDSTAGSTQPSTYDVDPTAPATPTLPPTPELTSPTPPATTGPAPIFSAEYPEAGNRPSLLRAGDTYVIGSRSVVGLGDTGRRRWQIPIPRGARDDAEIAVARNVVVVTHSIRGQDWPGLTRVLAVDAGSGKQLWHDDSASFVSTWGDTVYTSVCTGEQDAQLGDCTLSARDPRSGATRWSVATYASAGVEDAGPDHLLVHSYPSGQPGVSQVLDPDTGAALGPALDQTYPAVSGGVLVNDGPLDDTSRDGCRQSVRATDFAGNVLWRRTVQVGKDRLDRGECYELYVESGEDGLVALSWFEGTPEVVDARTGRRVWRGRAGEELDVVGRALVVAVRMRNGFAAGTRGVDPRTGKVLWTAPRGAGDTWVRDGRRLIASDYQCYPCLTQVYGVRSGRVITEYEGFYTSHGRGWLATIEEPLLDQVGYAAYRYPAG